MFEPNACMLARAAMPDAVAHGSMDPALLAHLATCPDCQAEWNAYRQIALAARIAQAAPPAPELAVTWTRLLTALPPPFATRSTPRSAVVLYAIDSILAQLRLIGGELIAWGGLVILLAFACWLLVAHQLQVIPLLTIPLGMMLVVRLWGLDRLNVLPEVSGTFAGSPLVILGLRVALGFGSQTLIQGSIAVSLMVVGGNHTPNGVVQLWLAPLICAMALALLATIALGPTAAAIASVTIWLARLAAQVSGTAVTFLTTLNRFWNSPIALFLVACTALLLAAIITQRRVLSAA